jgi:hypothetical protein
MEPNPYKSPQVTGYCDKPSVPDPEYVPLPRWQPWLADRDAIVCAAALAFFVVAVAILIGLLRAVS